MQPKQQLAVCDLHLLPILHSMMPSERREKRVGGDASCSTVAIQQVSAAVRSESMACPNSQTTKSFGVVSRLGQWMTFVIVGVEIPPTGRGRFFFWGGGLDSTM